MVAAVSDALGALEGFRYAEAGEFTRRAFENGKLDLTRVEGLADLVAAQTEMQRRMALDQAGGALQALYDGWMRRLTHCRALVEAGLDFSDEDDVPEDVSDGVRSDIGDIRGEMAAHLDRARTGEFVRDGCRVAIAGAPNAGKSSLLNALARREVAIVSDEPGTTRDVLTVTLDLDGYAVIVQDTAGLREAVEKVEQEGIRRAQAAIDAADIVLFLCDLSSMASVPAVVRDKTILVGTKADLVREAVDWRRDIDISVAEGTGLDALVAMIAGRVRETAAHLSEAVPTRARHEGNLRRALACLDAALETEVAASELLAEDIRSASEALGRLTGQVDVEDLLDVIFSSFCVGK